MIASPVKEFANSKNIPVLQPEKIREIKETLEQVWDNDQRYRSSFNSEKLLKKYGENLKKLKLKYLPVIEQTVKNGNMRLKDYAMFKDKIEIEQNKNQIYGSQLVWNNDNGQYELLPIMEPERS